jgi:hypothetical protein
VKALLSKFFNLHLRRGLQTIPVDSPSLLERFEPVFSAAENLGFTSPILRGGAVRDVLHGQQINDYDLYVSRAQIANGLRLPSIHSAEAEAFYRAWLSKQLGLSDLKPQRQHLTDRPFLAFSVRFAGVPLPIDLVINDEVLSPEKLALEADATMNGIAASRTRIVAHPLFFSDTEAHVYRPTCATVGNLISAPLRFRAKFARRDPRLTYRWF